jgi:hypothetical protein
MTAADDIAIWDRRPGETGKQFHAFTHYRDQGAGRSILRAYRVHLEHCERRVSVARAVSRRWSYWCSGWGWKERAASWDARNEQLARGQVAKDQVDARVRHARMANAALQTLTVPSRALLEALQDPNVMPRLVAEARESSRGVFKLLELVTWCGRTIPGLVEVERLALGMSTEVIEIDDKREDTIGARIASDPKATDLAIQLLDAIAGTKEAA